MSVLIRDAKVYSDGSHYIGIIPKRGRRKRHQKEAPKTTFTVMDKNGSFLEGHEDLSAAASVHYTQMDYKSYFDRLYSETVGKPQKEQRQLISELFTPFFKSEEEKRLFLEAQFLRKKHNFSQRTLRMFRKAALQEWDYFCTFTYDDKKHNEDSFKFSLRRCFKDMCYRREWKYIGVWERAPQTERLHFHGIFSIPPGQMIGELFEEKSYSVKQHRVQTTWHNSYFDRRFGRSDFESITERGLLDDALLYLLKYIEKTGERLVYSGGLPQFIMTDIDTDDVVLYRGWEKRKMLLSDDFTCYKGGEAIGAIADVRAEMPTAN